MIRFKTVKKAAEAEKTIERSRFIGHVKPVGSKAEAEAFITEIRALYRDATHNVPAYIVGDKSELQWASDDGEPSGTSGAPMLQMMVREGITNIVIVVTRYFGGIKLGPGGLVRAYTSVAKLVIEKAGICEAKEMARFSARMDYTYYGKLQNMAAAGDFRITDVCFDDCVNATLLTDLEKSDDIKKSIAELTGGSCTFSTIGIVLDYK